MNKDIERAQDSVGQPFRQVVPLVSAGLPHTSADSCGLALWIVAGLSRVSGPRLEEMG